VNARMPDVSYGAGKQPVGFSPIGAVIVGYGPGLALVAEFGFFPPFGIVIDAIRRVGEPAVSPRPRSQNGKYRGL